MHSTVAEALMLLPVLLLHAREQMHTLEYCIYKKLHLHKPARRRTSELCGTHTAQPCAAQYCCSLATASWNVKASVLVLPPVPLALAGGAAASSFAAV